MMGSVGLLSQVSVITKMSNFYSINVVAIAPILPLMERAFQRAALSCNLLKHEEILVIFANTESRLFTGGSAVRVVIIVGITIGLLHEIAQTGIGRSTLARKCVSGNFGTR